MILFMRDWMKHPTARPDYTTRNTSFIKLASLYKKMGIKNHSFLLALVDQRLKGINPHDPNLDQITKARIAVEQKINPWYWFREVARVPGISGSDDRPLQANRGIIAALWLFFTHTTTFLTQPRQTGKSLCMELLTIYLTQVICKRTKIGLLTRSEYLRVSTVEKIKEASKSLPPYINFMRKDDANNTFSFTVNALKNKFNAYLPSVSEKTADALGRGFTMGIVFGDEVPFQPNAHITIPVLLATSIAAREAAKRSGSPYGILFTSTAGDMMTPEGAYMHKLQNDGAVWTEHFLDLDGLTELEETVRANSRGKTLRGDGVNTVNVEMDHRQLGKTDEWLVDAAEVTGSKGEVLRMDYFNEWRHGTSSHPLSRALQTKLSENKKNVVYTEIDDSTKYAIRWYVEKGDIKRRMDGDIVISVDSSDAGGGDDISLVISDMRTGEVIGAGTFNYTSITMWAKWLFSLMIKYPKALLMVEKKSSGMSIMDSVVELLNAAGINPFKRVFNMIVHNHRTDPRLYDEMKGAIANGNIMSFYFRHKKRFGFSTNGTGETSRATLYGALREMVSLTGHRLYDHKLIQQILGLIEKNGRIDHQPGEHDDMVIARLLAYWLMSSGNNLKYYGIDPLKVLRYVIPESSKDSTVDSDIIDAELLYQDTLKRNIDILKDKHRAVTDPTMLVAIRNKIMALANKLTDNTDDSYNKEQLINSLQERNKNIIDRKREKQSATSLMSPFV